MKNGIGKSWFQKKTNIAQAEEKESKIEKVVKRRKRYNRVTIEGIKCPDCP